MILSMSASTTSDAPSVTPAADGAPDPRPLLGRALDQIAGLVAAITPADAGLPTPCQEFTVLDLGGHLVSVLRRITALGEGTDPMALPHVTEVPVGELAAALAGWRARYDVAYVDDAVLEKPVVLPWATGTVREIGPLYVQELTVHAWDLATALGRGSAGLDPELAAAVLPLARQFVPADHRGGPVPFAPPVPVAADAGPYEQLVAWLGRDPSGR